MTRSGGFIFRKWGGRAILQQFAPLVCLNQLLQSPQNLLAYVPESDLFDLAAAYVFHIAENQPFVDGNKRTAFLAAMVFLDVNGHPILDPSNALYEALIAIAERRLDKAGLAKLFRSLAVGE